MDIHAIGVNYNQHPVEEVSFPRVKTDALLLLTCNRAEVYYYGEEDDYLDLYDVEHFPSFRYKGRVAARHIIEVACGVKSMVLGDRHVFHQMKEAYDKANVQEPIHELIQTGFQAAKAVQMNDSVPARAVRQAEPTQSALVIGAGQMAKDVISKLNCKTYVTNRTRSRAEKLPPETIGWDRRQSFSKQVETVFVTTGADTPVYQSNGSADVYDLSNPPNVEGKATRIDDLVTKRKEGLPRAKKICRRKTDEFMSWYDHYKNIKPAITSFNKTIEKVRLDQIEDHAKSEMEKKEVKRLTDSIIDKITAIPAKRLREIENKDGISAENHVRAIQNLFTPEA